MFRGSLYKKYPSMWRRLITVEERKRINQMGKLNLSFLRVRIREFRIRNHKKMSSFLSLGMSLSRQMFKLYIRHVCTQWHSASNYIISFVNSLNQNSFVKYLNVWKKTEISLYTYFQMLLSIQIFKYIITILYKLILFEAIELQIADHAMSVHDHNIKVF